MNFWYEVKRGEFYFSQVVERYDSHRKKHIFFYCLESENEEEIETEEKEILTIDPLTAEIEWHVSVDETFKNDNQILSAVRDFKNDTCFANRDKEIARRWLESHINQYVNLGFSNEIVVSVNGENTGGDKVYWVVKRIYSFMGDGQPLGEPVIVTRYMTDENSNKLYYQQFGREIDLYLNNEGNFDSKEIFNILWKDIDEMESEIYDIAIEYRARIDYSRYFDF